MTRLTPLVRLIIVAVLALAAGAAVPALTSAGQASSPTRTGHWINTWASMPQLTEPHNLPPAPYTEENLVLDDTTLRQTVRVTAGGQRMRLRFSNAFGGVALPITKVSIALPAEGKAGARAIAPGTSQQVTFQGRPSVTIPIGALAVSDPLNFLLRPGTNLTVTIYLAEGQASNLVTSHPGSRTTSHLLRGDHVTAEDLPEATATAHWYFLSGVEVWARSTTNVLAIVGDSLTDGRGSTTDGNDRWPDQLYDRLRSANLAIINQAAGGNRVLNDGLGPNVLARFDRDVLAQSGVRWLILFEGVNDIGTAEATPAAQKQVAEDLIAAYESLIVRAHAHGIRVYGATITPFVGSFYDDPDGLREAARQTVNQWIRTSRQFDAVLDFDKAVRDPAGPTRLLPAYDTGDHLHMNPTGYKAIAESVPSWLLKNTPLPPGFGF
jgi:lysophospholipase L1-like esterase